MDKTNIEYVLPEEIEMRSFEIIAAELAERGITLPAEQDMITRRVIHTSADFDYAETMTYSDLAVEKSKNLKKNGEDIETDTNKEQAGTQRWQQWRRNAGPPGQRSAWNWQQNGKSR